MILPCYYKKPLRPVACLEFSQDGLQGMIENSLDFGAGGLGFELKLYHWIVCDLGQLVEPFWTQFIIWIWQDNLVIYRLVFLAIFYPKRVGGCTCLRALRSCKSPIWQPLTKISEKLMGAEAWSWWGRGNLPWEKEGGFIPGDREDGGVFSEECRTCKRASSWIAGGPTKSYGLRSHREEYMAMLVMDQMELPTAQRITWAGTTGLMA